VVQRSRNVEYVGKAGDVPMTETAFVKPEEVARILRSTPRHVQKLAKEERLPGAVYFGKLLRFHRRTIEEHLKVRVPVEDETPDDT
jgi:excisionase family DNA binding protein